MQAAFYRATGPADLVLEVGELADPVPDRGEVLVRVGASGINPADVKRRAGWGGMTMMHDLVVPHSDGAGTIVGVGAGVPAERTGERVWLYNAQGGYGRAGRAMGTAAGLVSIPADQAVVLPDVLSFAAGACLGVPAVTAHRCIHADGPVRGQTVLVQGGAGAVGHFAVQIAFLGGAQLIATIGGPEGAAHAMAAGAVATVDHKAGDVVARVMDLTGGAGVDRIVEVDFAANMADDAHLLKPNGTIASYSSSSDPRPVLSYYDFASKGLNLRFIQGFCLPADAHAAAVAFIASHAADLIVSLGATYPLVEIATAHRRVEAGGIGNIVLI